MSLVPCSPQLPPQPSGRLQGAFNLSCVCGRARAWPTRLFRKKKLCATIESVQTRENWDQSVWKNESKYKKYLVSEEEFTEEAAQRSWDNADKLRKPHWNCPGASLH